MAVKKLHSVCFYEVHVLVKTVTGDETTWSGREMV